MQCDGLSILDNVLPRNRNRSFQGANASLSGPREHASPGPADGSSAALPRDLGATELQTAVMIEPPDLAPSPDDANALKHGLASPLSFLGRHQLLTSAERAGDVSPLMRCLVWTCLAAIAFRRDLDSVLSNNHTWRPAPIRGLTSSARLTLVGILCLVA